MSVNFCNDCGSMMKRIDGEWICESCSSVDFSNGDNTIRDSQPQDLESIDGIGSSRATALQNAGFQNVADIQAASRTELKRIKGIGDTLASRIKRNARDVTPSGKLRNQYKKGGNRSHSSTSESGGSSSETTSQDSSVKHIRRTIKIAIESAQEAKESGNYDKAIQYYKKALDQYQTAKYEFTLEEVDFLPPVSEAIDHIEEQIELLEKNRDESSTTSSYKTTGGKSEGIDQGNQKHSDPEKSDSDDIDTRSRAVDTDDTSGDTQAASGQLKWTFSTNGQVRSSPTVANGTIFVGSDDSCLYAVDAETGEEKWRFQIGGRIESSPTVVGSAVFITSESKLYAIDAETGGEKWELDTGDSIRFCSPSVWNDNVIVGNLRGSLYSVDATSGEEELIFKANDQILSSPTVADGIAFFGSYDHTLYAIDAETGAQLWSFNTGGRIFSSPTIIDRTVVTGSFNGDIYGVDVETGEKIWTLSTDDRIFSSPTVYNRTVFVGSFDHRLYAINAKTGEKKWVFNTQNVIWSSPTVVEDTVLFGSNDGNLYAVDRSSGDQRWAFDTGEPVRSSPTVVDGTVYIGSDDGKLYAIETSSSGNSEGSRGQFKTLGHSKNTQRPDMSITIPSAVQASSHSVQTDDHQSNKIEKDPSLLSRIMSTLTSSTSRKRTDANSRGLFGWLGRSGNEEQAGETETARAGMSTGSPTGIEYTASELTEVKNRIVELVDRAETAEGNGNLQEAQEHYETAIEQYEQASGALDADSEDPLDKLDNGIENLETRLESVTNQREQITRLNKTIKKAERSFQEAIIGCANDSQTVSTTRFRQARDAFAEATEIAEGGSNSLLGSPVRCDVTPQLSLSATSLEDISGISGETVAALAAADIETIHDLDPVTDLDNKKTASGLDEEIITTDDEITVLTILSWLNMSEPYVFDTLSVINQRHTQAKYGFTHT